MIKKLFNTILFLRPTQIYHQFLYRGRNILGLKINGKIKYNKVADIVYNHMISTPTSYFGNRKFKFLNITHVFNEIDWNYNQYGKLWTYNLNYFDYLHQENMPIEDALQIMHDFIRSYDDLKDGHEPYPTSLRIINVVKYVLIHKINDEAINELLSMDLYRLTHTLEYHLLANHLLENAFALCFGGLFLQNSHTIALGKKLLKEQLDEQIMKDGAHYELSPMYHQLMLFRVMDSVQLFATDQEMTSFLLQKATAMCGWLRTMTFANGDFPLVNDAANGINPTSLQLFYYADNLGIQSCANKLSVSGYRKYNSDKYEIIADIGNVSPNYQPGHTHADTLSYVLYINKAPFIVDTGTSTYNVGVRRSHERSTSAHNTVTIDSQDSSEVWSGFRVGKRANVSIIEDTPSKLSALHDGYNPIFHHRKWCFADHNISIQDEINKNNKEVELISHMHFHPDVIIEEVTKQKVKTNLATIIFEGAKDIVVKNYLFAPEFNKLIPSNKIEVAFESKLTALIE